MMHKNQPRDLYRKILFGDGCWEYQGGCVLDGYGQFALDGKDVRAHRVMFEIHNGPIPAGQVVRHKCDNPPCCNPLHLELGTIGDNLQDAYDRGRRGV